MRCEATIIGRDDDRSAWSERFVYRKPSGSPKRRAPRIAKVVSLGRVVRPWSARPRPLISVSAAPRRPKAGPTWPTSPLWPPSRAHLRRPTAGIALQHAEDIVLPVAEPHVLQDDVTAAELVRKPDAESSAVPVDGSVAVQAFGGTADEADAAVATQGVATAEADSRRVRWSSRSATASRPFRMSRRCFLPTILKRNDARGRSETALKYWRR